MITLQLVIELLMPHIINSFPFEEFSLYVKKKFSQTWTAQFINNPNILSLNRIIEYFRNITHTFTFLHGQFSLTRRRSRSAFFLFESLVFLKLRRKQLFHYLYLDFGWCCTCLVFGGFCELLYSYFFSS